jgi:Mrp family chromosome partitioning ATPase/uncharacterized protein involved in exopolysaccharide biosynthesis
VFAVFAAYAFLSPATYRTSALVHVEPIGSATAATLPAPLEAARRLREVVLARDVLERLAGEAAVEDRLAAASRIRDGLQIDTIDSRVFSVSYKDSEPARAQRLCNQLARQAAERAPRALLPPRSTEERQQESERDQRSSELVAFLAAHPEVQQAPAPSGSPPREDAALTALRTERARLAQRLAALSAPSDNPYQEPADVTLPPEQIKRRIAEIDHVIASRRRVIEQPGARAGTPSPFDEQWRKMLQALSELPSAAPPVAASELFKARLAAEAPLPSSPVEPNRILVLFIGLLASLGAAGLTIIARSVGQRRGSTTPLPRARTTTDRFTAAPSFASATSSPPPEFAPEQTLPLPATSATAPDRRSNGSAPPAVDRPADAFASTLKAPVTEAVARPSSSILPHAVIEINAAPHRSRDSERPPAEGARRARGPARVTQVLGSPISPIIPVDGNGADAPGIPPRIPEFSHTERSSPEQEPARIVETFGSEVIGAAPAGLPRDGAEVSTALARVDSAPQVITFDISGGWQPDPEIVPSRRHALRDELVSHFNGRCFVVGVSGAAELSQEKSRLSLELALALSERERTRVLVLEADFQQPSLHRLARARLPVSSGFSQQLHQRASAPPDMLSQWVVARCSSRLDVLAEGVMRAPGLMATAAFGLAIAELRRFYDFIVIDGPPLALAEDCRVLDRLVDGMLFLASGSTDPAMAQVNAVFSGKVFSKIVKPLR